MNKKDGYYYTNFNHKGHSCHKKETDAAIQYDRLVLASGQQNPILNFQWKRQ
jgi:NADH dehydrogenase FAD-containing subunit